MLLLDICICAIIFLIGYNLKFYFKGFNKEEKKLLTQLFFYHILIAIIFHFYVEANGGDAIKYWYYPKEKSFDDIIYLIVNRKANNFMYLVNYLPSVKLGLSFFTGNMLYALLGYLGFVYLLKIIKEILPDTREIKRVKIFGIPLFPWILFLPNLHFWSSGIGKDTFLFLVVILFVYAIKNVKKRRFIMLISLVISLAIRPHITLFLLVAFGIGYIIDGRFKLYQKILISLVFVIGFVSIFDYVVQFVQLESLEMSTLGEFVDQRVLYLSEERVGSRVDMSGYPFPFKVFTFLYRPLFFDGNGVLGIVSSLENVVLLIITFLMFRSKPVSNLRKSNFLMKGMVLYFVIGSIALSLILSNLGIMLRQKNMFIPAFLLFGLWLLDKKIRTQNNFNEGT